MSVKLIIISLFFLLTSYITYREVEIYQQIEMPSSTGARCLDGSPFHINVQKGHGSGSNNYLLFFDGGGWCSSKTYNSTMESCDKRTNSYLGSSQDNFGRRIMNYLQTTLLMKRLVPALSSDQNLNPAFHNWNKIYLNYCDGRGYIGFNNEPIEYNGKQFYFRGFNNTQASLDYVKDKMMVNDNKSTNKVVVSGTSAGGVATFYYADYIKSFFGSSAEDVKAISDSGMFLDSPNLKNKKFDWSVIWKDLLKNTNPQFPFTFPCKYSGSETYKCYFPENYYQHIKVPILIIHSFYDFFASCNLIGDCKLSLFEYSFENVDETNLKSYNMNREKLMGIFKDIKSRENMAGYAPACYVHDFIAYTGVWDSIQINGKSPRDVINEFVNEGKLVSYLDEEPWPSNPTCAYKREFAFLLHYTGFLIDLF